MNYFWPKIKENPVFAILLAILLVALIAGLILWSRNLFKQNDYIGKSPSFDRTITITGEGKVTAIPDIATVSLGLSTEKNDISAAQQQNSQTMNSLIEKLNALSIAKEDIKTTDYSIFPVYDYPIGGSQVLRGYTVSQTVTVKIRDTAKVDQVLKIAGDLKLNQVYSLSFNVDDPEVYNQEARIKAVENAKAKADALAKAMGVKIGKVMSFSEMGGYYPTPYYSKGAEMGGGGSISPTTQPGSQEIIINATITYELE